MPELTPVIPWQLLSLALLASIYAIYKLWERNKKKRPIYLIFRLLSTLFIFFCAFQPRWNTVKKISSKSELIFLTDQSASMKIRDEIKNQTRLQTAINLHKDLDRQLKENSDKLLTQKMFFDDQLYNKLNPKSRSQATAITQSIIDTLRKNPNSHKTGLILFSDGQNNSGSHLQKAIYESQKYNCPIYPVKIGQDTLLDASTDIQVVKFKVPSLVQSKKTIKVTAQLKFQNLRNKPLIISLKLKNDKTLISQPFTPSSQNQLKSFSFEIKTDDIPEGHHLLEISCPGLSTEITPANNTLERLFFLRDSGIKVLLLASTPNPNFKFMKRSLEQTHQINLTAPSPFKLQSPSGRQELEQLKLQEFDCIILCEPQVSLLPKGFIESIFENTSRRTQGLLILPSLSLARYFNEHPEINEALPLNFQDIEISTKKEFYIESIASHYVSEAILKEKDLSQALKESSLNGIYLKLDKQIGQKNLLSSSETPILSLRPWAKARIAILTTNALWQLNLRNPKSKILYNKILSRLIFYLSSRDQNLSASLVLQSDKFNYLHEDTIQLSADFINEDGNTANDSELKLIIKGPENHELTIAPKNNNYKHNIKLNTPGLYSLQSFITRNGKDFQSPLIKVYVEASKVELSQTNINMDSLTNLAEKSKGRVIPPAELAKLIDELAEQSKTTSISVPIKSQPIWDNNIILALIVISFCLEWFFRRRHGLS